MKTWRNVASELLNYGLDIIHTIDSSVAVGARFSAGHFVIRELVHRGLTVDNLQQKLLEMNQDSDIKTFATDRLQMILQDVVEKVSSVFRFMIFDKMAATAYAKTNKTRT